MKYLTKTTKYFQGILGLNKNDIILASFPKSGNTWVRFFFCNLISLIEWGGQIVDFHELDRSMPEFGVDNLLSHWNSKTVNRVVKTHKKFLPIFKGKKAILVIRDPKDTMVSFYHFNRGKREDPFKGTFQEFIRHRKYGLESWLKFHQSWLKHYHICVRYEDLKESDIAQFQDIVEACGIKVEGSILNEAVKRSRFDNIRRLEEKFGHSKPEFFKDGNKFTRKGKSGGWTDFFDKQDIELYRQLKKRYEIDLY